MDTEITREIEDIREAKDKLMEEIREKIEGLMVELDDMYFHALGTDLLSDEVKVDTGKEATIKAKIDYYNRKVKELEEA